MQLTQRGRVLRDLLFHGSSPDRVWTVEAGTVVDLLHPSQWTERMLDHVERKLRGEAYHEAELTGKPAPYQQQRALWAKAKDRWVVMLHVGVEQLDEYALLLPGVDVEVEASEAAPEVKGAPRRAVRRRAKAV
jgi:hypothetical protein